MLRRLKAIAARAGVKHATLHKFRHTYATRLLEKDADIVTVQHLLGHSDLDTTRRYLSPEDMLKRAAVNRLSLSLLRVGLEPLRLRARGFSVRGTAFPPSYKV